MPPSMIAARIAIRGSCSLMKKRLRLLRTCCKLQARSCRKLFADEEAIETMLRLLHGNSSVSEAEAEPPGAQTAQLSGVRRVVEV